MLDQLTRLKNAQTGRESSWDASEVNNNAWWVEPGASPMFDRRQFLTATGASLVGGLNGTCAAADPVQISSKHYRVIDTHFHLFNSTLQGRDGIPTVLNLDATVDAGVSALKRGGVEKAFLITYNAQDIAEQFRYRKQDPALLRRVYNTQYQLAAWKAYPEIFCWFPDHVDPLRETYLEDLERDFEAGASGIKLLPIFHGFLPDHPGFRPVYRLCQERKKPIILDISWWYMEFMQPRYETPLRRAGIRKFSDYAKLLAGIFREYPQTAFSLAHTGAARDMADYDQIFRLVAEHPNVSCDIAASQGYSAAFVQRLVKAVGARKVMYGTDWPYWSSGPFSYTEGQRRWTMITEECPALNEADKRMILAENADRFLKNELPGLEPEAVAERARKVHRKSIVIVIHDHNPIRDDVERMLTGGVTAKVYQLQVDVEIGKDYQTQLDRRDGWTNRALAEIKRVRNTIENDKRLTLALTADDIVHAKKKDKVAIMIGVEGAKLLEGKLDTLKQFYELGLRELQLTWAVPNQLVEQDVLTAFGIQVVRECQRLGIIVDVTHIRTRAFYEVIDLMQRPLIVSHGAAAGVRTDLDDRKIKAIASRGGVLGIHFYSSYQGPQPTVDRVVDHIDYIAQLVGIEAAGLGVDFFPTEGKWREFQLAQGTTDISWAVPHIGELDRVTQVLAARSYSDEDIQRVLGGNFLRVCHEVFGE